MDMEIELEKLGLLKSESKVYIALLKIGENSPGKIAKETGLNRVSVYRALDKLMKLGLISHIVKSDSKYYSANNPKNIFKIIDEKKEILDDIKEGIPLLQGLFNGSKNEFQINIYDGIKGAKSMWEGILDECKDKDTWYIVGAPKSAESYGGYFKDFNKKRAKKKVFMKIIYNIDAKELYEIRKKQAFTEVKVMAKEYITPVSFEVINDNLLIVVYEPKLVIFHLKNLQITNSFKIYFELLWKIAKSVN